MTREFDPQSNQQNDPKVAIDNVALIMGIRTNDNVPAAFAMDAQNRLATTATVVLSSGIEVELSHTNDSILTYGQDQSAVHHAILTDELGRIQVIASGINVNVEVDIDQQNDSILIYGQDFNGTNRAARTDIIGRFEVISSGINAATETTLSSLNSKDFATETTLVNAGNILSGIQVDTQLLVDRVATETTSSAIASSVASIDGKLKNYKTDGDNRLEVIASGINVNVNVDISEVDDSIAVYGNDGSANKILKTDTVGRLEVIASGININVDVDITETNDSILVYGQDSTSTNRALRTDNVGRLEVISSGLDTAFSNTYDALRTIDVYPYAAQKKTHVFRSKSTLTSEWVSGTPLNVHLYHQGTVLFSYNKGNEGAYEVRPQFSDNGVEYFDMTDSDITISGIDVQFSVDSMPPKLMNTDYTSNKSYPIPHNTEFLTYWVRGVGVITPTGQLEVRTIEGN